jgi:Lrp/AsnC family transcriptional regulator, leucine-responsive regulatory protein
LVKAASSIPAEYRSKENMAASGEIDSLDAIDCAILEVLQREARESFTRIGRQVGLSSTAVSDRMRHLEATGVIAGYHADVVPKRAGFPIMAFLLVRSTGPDARFSKVVQSRPEIIECYRVTGEVSFVIRTVLSRVEHLEELIDYLEQTSYVTTLIVLSTALKRPGLPLVESKRFKNSRSRRRVR